MHLAPHQLYHVSRHLFRVGWGKWVVRFQPSWQVSLPCVSISWSPLHICCHPPFQTSILKGQALSESKCEWRNTQFARPCIAKQSGAFLKKSFVLLYDSTFTLLLFCFVWNFFLPCALIYHHAFRKGNTSQANWGSEFIFNLIHIQAYFIQMKLIVDI